VRYDRITRLMHAGMALGVLAQLGLSLAMEAPDDQDEEMASGLPLKLFFVHEYIGLALLVLLVLHWLWSMSGHVSGGFGHLFPWFSRERMQKVLAETRVILQLKLLDPEVDNELAGAVHGLGLLTATAMAATGTVLYFNITDSGHWNDLAHTFHSIHGFLSWFMWAYVISHVFLAVLHKRAGRESAKDIFTFK
jgi:cytochrome b561